MIIVKFIVKNFLRPAKTFLLTEENLLPSVATCGNIEEDLLNFLEANAQNFKAVYHINRKTFRQYGDNLYLVFELLVSAKDVSGHRWVEENFANNSYNSIQPIDRFFLQEWINDV